MAKQTLAEWIHEARCEGDPLLGGQQEQPISMIALVHLVGGGAPGGSQKEIWAVKFGGTAWKNEELAAKFEQKARNSRQDMPGLQYFALLAFYGTDTQPKLEHPFAINIAADAGGLFSEPPDARGEKQQSMRHTEVVFQTMLNHQQHLNMLTGGMIKQLVTERTENLHEVREMWKVFQEMAMEKATNQHERRMKELEHERSTMQRQELFKMLPPLVNTVTGREVFPVGATDTALLEAIAEAIDKNPNSGEALGGLAAAGIIPQEIMGALMSRIQQVNQKRRQEEADRRAMVPVGNPELDAIGGAE